MLKSRRLWLGLSASLIFILLFLATLDFRELVEALIDANYLFVLPAVAFYFVAVGFRTLRWRYLLYPLRPMSTTRLFPVVVVGYMANNLLPVRLGELVRSYYLGEREDVSKTAGLATILVERVFDGLVLLFFLAVVALFLPLAGLVKGLGESSGVPWPILSAALSLPFFVILGTLIFFAFYPPGLQRLVERITRTLPQRVGAKVQRIVELFVEGLIVLRSPRNLLALFALSLPVWLFEAALFFLIGFSFDLDSQFSNLGQMAVATLLVTAIANLGGSLPSSPGGIGLFELFARETLILLPVVAIDRAVAGAYALTAHAALIVPVILLGQIFLFSEHISFSQLTKREGQAVPEYGVSSLSAEGDEPK